MYSEKHISKVENKYLLKLKVKEVKFKNFHFQDKRKKIL